MTSSIGASDRDDPGDLSKNHRRVRVATKTLADDFPMVIVISM